MDGWVLLLLLSCSLLAYTSAGYPLVLLAWSRLARRPPAPPAVSPLRTVSLVVAAHNEQRVIGEKIRNSLALDYPEDRLELLVGSDGSTDATDEICRREPRVRLLRLEPRAGKASVLNALVPLARGEILLFSDANSMLDPGALEAMVRHFADPAVGGVCGRLVLTAGREDLAAMERAYWDYETWVKDLESRCFSTIGANGGIYAIRRELFSPIPADTIVDDFLVSLGVLEQGRRLAFERGAVATEEVSLSFREEFARKARIGAGNLQLLLRRAGAFVRVPPFVTFAFLSHKLIRWAMPLLLAGIWAASLALSGRQPYRALFWACNAGVLLAALGLVWRPRIWLLRALAYALSVNLALLLGYARYLLGRQAAAWRPARR